MKFDRKMLTLYAVTDRRCLRPGERLEEAVEEIIKAGVTCVQLREKKLDGEAFLKEAESLAAVCRRYRIPLIINDRPEIARAVGADGVHVGQSDMEIGKARELLGEDCIIGGSVHSVEEALDAQAAGADYIGCGAVFGSRTKPDASVLPYDELRAICRAAEVPAVAIGGINRENVRRLAGSGIAGIAAVGALFAGADRAADVRGLLAAVRELQHHPHDTEHLPAGSGRS